MIASIRSNRRPEASSIVTESKTVVKGERVSCLSRALLNYFLGMSLLFSPEIPQDIRPCQIVR